MYRRQILKSAASLPLIALGAELPQIASALSTIKHSLTAQIGPAQITDMRADQAWSYGQTFLDGQPLRMPLGQDVQIETINGLSEATSIHWHGLRVPPEMDGSNPMMEGSGTHLIAPGEQRIYAFTPKDPGLYWFHAHNQSWSQVGRGLYDALLVDHGQQLELDDHILLLDDWPTRWDRLQFSQLGNVHDWSHAGHVGNVATVNAKSIETIQFQRGKLVRLRFLNTATARVFTPQISFALNAQAYAVALDGYDIAPRPLSGDWFALGPGQRTDLIVDTQNLPNSAQLDLSGGPKLRFEEIETSAQQSLNLEDALAAISAYQPMELMPGRPHQTRDLVMAGGAMGGMPMMGDGQFWVFGRPGQQAGAPLFSGRVGETVQLNLRNDTRFVHTIHWHGQHALVAQSSRLLEQQPALRDGVTLAPGETSRVQFRLAERGQWLLHCHMLGHQAAGMSTYFEIV